MKEIDRSNRFNVPKRVMVPFTLALGALYLFAILSERFKQGTLDFSMVGVSALASNVWIFRDLWARYWFWLVLAAFGALHAIFVTNYLLPPLLVGHGNRGAGVVLFWMFDSFLIYSVVRLAETASLGWPKTIEVACRVCGKDVDKRAAQCPYCGTWKPVPLSGWTILIAFAPIFMLLVFVLFYIGPKSSGSSDKPIGTAVRSQDD